MLASSVDERGLTVYYWWDDLMRLTDASYSKGTASLRYSRLDLERVIAPSGNVPSRFVYDAMRQLGVQYDGRGNTNAIGYSCGLVSCVTNALGQTNAFTYDNNGLLLAKTHHDKSVETWRYDRLGQLTNRTDAAGISVTNWYNHQGLLASVSNAWGRVVSYQYDVRDRVTNTVDGNGVSTSFTYDALGRMLARAVSGAGTERFQYSPLGLVAHTNQLGQITRFGYDLLGRKTSETNANGEVTRYEYNSAGDLLAVTDAKNHRIHWDFAKCRRGRSRRIAETEPDCRL